jgi:hypothetical protein
LYYPATNKKKRREYFLSSTSDLSSFRVHRRASSISLGEKMKNICYNNSVGGRVENRKYYSDHNSVTWRIWPLGVHGYFTIAMGPPTTNKTCARPWARSRDPQSSIVLLLSAVSQFPSQKIHYHRY